MYKLVAGVGYLSATSWWQGWDKFCKLVAGGIFEVVGNRVGYYEFALFSRHRLSNFVIYRRQ